MIFDEGVNIEGLFDNANQATLQKALEAGYGTDASQFTDGRALQPEDLESTLVNVLDVLQDDCKVFNSIYRQPSKSTVHQYNRRTGVGDDEFNFIGEGEEIREGDQDIERKILEQKYIGTIGRITKQAELVESMEDMYNAEKVACTMRVVKSAERAFSTETVQLFLNSLTVSRKLSRIRLTTQQKKPASALQLQTFAVTKSAKKLLLTIKLFSQAKICLMK